MPIPAKYMDSCKAIVREFLKEQTKKVVDYLRLRYNVPGFDPSVKICFRKNRRLNWGGFVYETETPFVNLCVHSVLWMVMQGPNCKKWHKEYGFLESDPELCSRKGSWKFWVSAMLTHELSHAIFYYVDHHKETRPDILDLFDQTVLQDKRGHGKLWQSIYRDLRVTFVNGVNFDMNDTVTAEPEKTKKVYNRKVITVATESKGGRYVEYQTPEGATIGKLFAKTGKPVQKLNVETGEYVDTTHTKLVEARKELLAEFGAKPSA